VASTFLSTANSKIKKEISSMAFSIEKRTEKNI